jgi:hypothetical protein
VFNEVDMLIFSRYFGSEVKGIKVRTVIKIRDNPRTKTWPREKRDLPSLVNIRQAVSEKMEM